MHINKQQSHAEILETGYDETIGLFSVLNEFPRFDSENKLHFRVFLFVLQILCRYEHLK